MALRGGRYELLGTIAAGGMASVHLGRALGAGGFERLVAVKTMHPHLAKEAEFVAMFLDEARLAARIRHPNVVGTLDIQQDEEGLFLVMEYVEGPSLARMLRATAKRNVRLPVELVLRVFLDTLAGLHAAHELTGHAGEPLNLIHRDMSPHNVLVGADGIARITDFGIARAESRLSSTRTGSIKGKTMYMAPEQVRSEPMDRRTDLYAAGAVLWELLTGERLVRADSEIGMIHQIIEATRKTPSDVCPDVPVEISEACMRALERKPDLRYPTATAFAEALESAAKASGMLPATPRVVGEYVRKLGVHATPGDLPASPVSSSMPNITSGPRPPMATPPSMQPPSDARAAITAVEVPAPSTGTRKSFASPAVHLPAEPVAPAARSRKGLVAGAIALTVVVIGAIAIVLGRGSSDAPGPAAAGGPGASAAVSIPVVTATAAASSAEPAPATPTASASASAAAQPPASAAPAASNAASAPARATVIAPSPSIGQKSGPRSGKTFRPKEL